MKRVGADALWEWFGLSYASWLTIPRVLMHEMPDKWQGKMAALLREYDEAFPNQPDIGTQVRVTTVKGKLIKTPEWLINYRYPIHAEIDKLKGPKTKRIDYDFFVSSAIIGFVVGALLFAVVGLAERFWPCEPLYGMVSPSVHMACVMDNRR